MSSAVSASSQALVDQYWRDGFVVVEGIYEPGECDAIAALAMQVSASRAETGGYAVDRSEDGLQAAPRKIGSPFLVDERFRRFVLDARLRQWLRLILGGPALLIADQIFFKPPRFGSEKPWHQDNGYFLIHPDDQVITAWIALDDVDEANGCLRYIAGSHRGGILEHRAIAGQEYNLTPAREQIDLSRERLAPVGKGGVVFHHAKTLHTSHRNHSDRWRRGYATHWCTAGVTCENQTLEQAYFRREDYPAEGRG